MNSLKVLQINLGHCQAAQDLMFQVAREKCADLVLVSEQYRDCPSHWCCDDAGTAAIYLPPATGARITGRAGAGCRGWTWVEVSGCRIYSCYFSPNTPTQQYEDDLQALEDDVRTANLPVLLAGDFNAWATDWGSSTTNRRGSILCEVAASLHLLPANVGGEFTFRRGTTGSVVDVTFASEGIIGLVSRWRVLNDYTHSDHQYVSFVLGEGSRAVARGGGIARVRWNLRSLDPEALTVMVDSGSSAIMAETGAHNKVSLLSQLVSRACDASMTRSSGKMPQRSVYWWTGEIASLRRSCLQARRRAQRSGWQSDQTEVFKEAKRALKIAIKRSKARCWGELCEMVDRDPWGLPYKLVRQKLRGRDLDPFLSDPRNLAAVIDGLFPVHNDRARIGHVAAVDDLELFTAAELETATKKVSAGKAPGLDEVPNEIMLLVARGFPEMLLGVYNACMRQGLVAAPWKRQRLVLILKKAVADGPSSFRPLCMLDGFGKLLERLVLGRLQTILEDPERGLSSRQYGFRRGRSTVDAIGHVVGVIRKAWEGTVKSHRQVVVVCLDIRNAFNSARWEFILRALREDFRVPEYLMALLEDYFDGRTLEYRHDASGVEEKRRVSSGVPQGSVLGPTLWNVMYDGLLRTEIPEGSSLVAFADDVAVVIEGKTALDLQYIGNEALQRVKDWLDRAGLELAVQKTKAVMFSRRRRPLLPRLLLEGFEVPLSKSMRYLGIQLDGGLRFGEHIELAAAKASGAALQLGRLMPNVGGPKSSRRKLLHGVVHSTLLYGAPIWARSLEKEHHRKKMAAVQRRSALRVISGYRTISEEAALVLASSPPIDLLALERQAVYEKGKGPQHRIKTMTEWQSRWSSATAGRWTNRLIGDLGPWCSRKHGDLNFRLTQLLSGHGCFGSFLHRIGKEATEACWHCDSDKDDAEHTLLLCPAWAAQRESLMTTVGANRLDVDMVVPSMLQNEETWQAWGAFASGVLGTKEEAERERRRLNVPTETIDDPDPDET
jgi:hypothetical protein